MTNNRPPDCATSRRRTTPHILLALAACLVVAACETAVNVEATAVVPARFSSVLVTIEQIWFNESAVAAPADAAWQKFELDKPLTLDLVDLTSGEVARIASNLKVPVGTYRQIRVLLASRDEPLRDSADDAGATYNNEVTWFDEDGDEETLPLEVLNIDQGVGVELELKVDEAFGVPSTAQLVFDAARDLTEFRYSGQTGFLLNASLKAFDPADTGTIRGSLNLSQLDFGDTGRPEIEVTAQKLDETLNRRTVVGRAAVNRSGSFVLHPLPLDEQENTTEYDLVIHGPDIRTIVLRDVPVAESAPDTAALLTLGNLAPEPADSFEVNIRADDPVVPRGAQIGFYQTLPDEDDPYLVDEAAVDPLSGRFAQPVLLSRSSTVSYATYGSSFTLRSGTPQEGAARFGVAALSPQYGSGALADATVRPPNLSSNTAEFSVPAIALPAFTVSGTISATLSVENPGRFDRGVLLVAREGAVVAAVSLDNVLEQSPASAFVDVAAVPAGTGSTPFDRGMYYIEAWTWDSDDAADTFTRHPGVDAIDLRSTASALASLAIR